MRYQALILGIVALFMLGVACDQEQSTTVDKEDTGDSLLPDSRMYGAVFNMYDRGRVVTEIQAAELVGFEKNDSTIAYTVDVDVFDSLGDVTSQLEGDSAIIREETGYLHIYGDVVLTRQDGTTLETQYLYFDSRNDSLHTHEFVKITRGEDVITGWGLDSDQQLKRFRLRDAQGKIQDVRQLDQELEKDRTE
jgi:LPS export ABC transporter protein LptC